MRHSPSIPQSSANCGQHSSPSKHPRTPHTSRNTGGLSLAVSEGQLAARHPVIHLVETPSAASRSCVPLDSAGLPFGHLASIEVSRPQPLFRQACLDLWVGWTGTSRVWRNAPIGTGSKNATAGDRRSIGVRPPTNCLLIRLRDAPGLHVVRETSRDATTRREMMRVRIVDV